MSPTMRQLRHIQNIVLEIIGLERTRDLTILTGASSCAPSVMLTRSAFRKGELHRAQRIGDPVGALQIGSLAGILLIGDIQGNRQIDLGEVLQQDLRETQEMMVSAIEIHDMMVSAIEIDNIQKGLETARTMHGAIFQRGLIQEGQDAHLQTLRVVPRRGGMGAGQEDLAIMTQTLRTMMILLIMMTPRTVQTRKGHR